MDTLDIFNTIEEKLCYKANKNRIPLSGAFELTPLCNMDCDMCYIRLTKEEMNKTGKLRTADEWLALAEEMKKEGMLFLLLTGGEPLIYKDFDKLYLGLKKMGLIVTINTNGTLINEEIADMFAKSKPRRVNITLYGCSNETYDKLCHNPKGFDQTIRGIKLLKERNIDVKLNVSLVKENKNDLPRMFEIANELDVPIKVDTYMFPRTKGIKGEFNRDCRLFPEEVAEIDMLIRYRTESEESFMRNRAEFLARYEWGKNNKEEGDLKMGCRAGKSSFWVNWQGSMSPCVFLENKSVDVFEDGFVNSWKYVVDECDNMFLPKKCSSCDKREVCQVCVASAYCENTDTNEKPRYLCEIIEKLIDSLK